MGRVLTAEHRIRSNPEACLVLSLEGGTADGGACVAGRAQNKAGVRDRSLESKTIMKKGSAGNN